MKVEKVESKKVRHLLGISGGKDSAALAIYMAQKHPELPIEYYWCDTGKELTETYELVANMEAYLGKSITLLKAASGSHHEAPFDHFMEQYGGYLPSSNARWCTKKLKLEPFEQFVGDDPVISYVGIRGDEEREGYISKKPNIQSIFPFRENIWSEDVIAKVLANQNIDQIKGFYKSQNMNGSAERIFEIVERPLSLSYPIKRKMEDLLDNGVKTFNKVVWEFLQNTDYPLSIESHFPLVDNEDKLIRADIFRILRESGVGVPGYYEQIPFKVNGKTGHYARSRSGCFFCFFQQKIEWVWLLEQHPDLYEKAIDYEKEGYKWMDSETLIDLKQPGRVAKIKEEFIDRKERSSANDSDFLLDILSEAEGEGCAACFI